MEKRKVILEFKAIDFQENGYTNCDGCAITTALKRAGVNGKDTGTCIIDSKGRVLTEKHDLTYYNLVRKVLGMYSFIDNEEYFHSGVVILPIKPQDFTHELEINY